MEEDVSVPESGLPENREGAPKIRLSQTSNSGLRVISGLIAEEENRALRWPYAMQTYSQMLKDATIAPAVAAVEMAVAQVPWTVVATPGKEEEQAKYVQYLKQVMVDMDDPFPVAVRHLATHNSYGFALLEKVFRFRETSKGSKFNDGLIGLKKLAPIPQDSVAAWNFKDNGRDLDGLYQAASQVSNRNEVGTGSTSFTENKPTFIPRKKFILVRNDSNKNNPEGTSPLKTVYRAWRYKQAMEEFEATSVSKDARGLKVLYLPPQYMSPDASPEDKAVKCEPHIRVI